MQGCASLGSRDPPIDNTPQGPSVRIGRTAAARPVATQPAETPPSSLPASTCLTPPIRWPVTRCHIVSHALAFLQNNVHRVPFPRLWCAGAAFRSPLIARAPISSACGGLAA
ncbi:hypothetical protein BDV95DRAFT_59063 [Massariosphaeria phaeospora]|uniref:Uncharacterized protein n=1 Tax=Massariosphaeria phaeospora TaxID=100035 RepID=A0A7C8M822_9PLEO|nr:hypothetical protein BDV95DRAFT_59063 [Massariosphaeria phaeospora]